MLSSIEVYSQKSKCQCEIIFKNSSATHFYECIRSIVTAWLKSYIKKQQLLFWG